MRKTLLLLVALLVAVSLGAAGRQDAEVKVKIPDPVEIIVLGGGDYQLYDTDQKSRAWIFDRLTEDFPPVITVDEDGEEAVHPQFEIEYYAIDVSDGSAFTVVAMLAAGRAPNIYTDTLVRSSAYFVPEYALALDDYIRDLDQYAPETLAPYRRDGKLLGLPQWGSAQAMAVNLDIMDAIGFTVRDDWSIAEFLDMAERVKQYYGGEKWATGMFAGNQSGDYLINNWFASFGVEYYNSGDYSRTTIRETGGAKVHEFFQTLAREGYIPPNCAVLTDDDYVIQWASGVLAAGAFFQPWTKSYFDNVIAQGMIDEPFRYKFVPFPRAPGVTSVPTYNMCGAYVVHQTDTLADEIAARWVEYQNSKYMQTNAVILTKSLSNRLDVTAYPDDEWTAQIAEILRTQGIYDVGLTNEKYQSTRPQHYPVLQKVLNLKITPEESIREYERRLNEALK